MLEENFQSRKNFLDREKFGGIGPCHNTSVRTA